jgi:hypothetical protein
MKHKINILISNHRPLFVLLFVSWILRLLLIHNGGQFYWPDETRYLRSLDFNALLLHGDFVGAMRFLLENAQHNGYILLGSLPAFFQQIYANFSNLSFEATLWIPTSFLALASVSAIAFVYLIELRVGASNKESLFAALLMASTNSMFYFSRHLLPYDSSITILLCALWLGLGKPTSVYRSFWVGVLVGFGFLIYNGYWVLALIMAGLHILKNVPPASVLLKRAFVTGVGVLTLPGLLILGSLLLQTTPIMKTLAAFSQTVTQGEFSEGWTFPFEYLWHSEGLILGVWAIGLIAALWFSIKSRNAQSKVTLRWLNTIISIYALLGLFSVVLHRFVVYGRSVRQMIPFICMICAFGLIRLSDHQKWSLGRQRLALLAVIIIAGVNFLAPLNMYIFPNTIIEQANKIYAKTNNSVTLGDADGSTFIGQTATVADSPYMMLNTLFLYPVKVPITPPEGEIVLSAVHPETYPPYQYEGYGPVERHLVRTNDISMRLIKLKVLDLSVAFDNNLVLYAVSFPQGKTVSRCNIANINSWWRASALIDLPYTVQIGLVDESGKIVVEKASTLLEPPLIAKQQIMQQHYLPIPCDLPQGSYSLGVALYPLGQQNKVPIVSDIGVKSENGFVLLGKLDIQ